MTTVLRRYNKLEIKSAYNQEFIAEIKKLGGKWQPSTKIWKVEVNKATEVIELIKSIYNEEVEVLDIVELANELKIKEDTIEGYRNNNDEELKEILIKYDIEFREINWYIDALYSLENEGKVAEFLRNIDDVNNFWEAGHLDDEKVIEAFKNWNK